MDALREAGTAVREPIHHFRAEVPAYVFGTLLPVLTKLRAVPRESRVVGGTYVVDGDIPAGRVHDSNSSCRRSPAVPACSNQPSTTTATSAARRPNARAPTSTRWTGRSTCCD